MVVDRLGDEQADEVLRALADATRRDIIRRAAVGELSVSALARAYPISTTAVQKHVAQLERAGLVTTHRHGRERRVRTDVATIRAAAGVLDQLERVWRDRVDRMDGLLAGDPPGGLAATPEEGT